MSDSLVLFYSDDEDSGVCYETKQYDNLSEMLKGVPPPSCITISKFTVDDILLKYNDNKESYGFGFSAEKCSSSPKNNLVNFINCSNSSQMSEKVDSLMQKVQERYVQLETMSTCNIWFHVTLQSCGSAKKRQKMRYAMGMSPGRRLSHLARRRQFFSSANLQRLANTDNIRQIEIKKVDPRRGERKKMNRTVEFEKLNSSKRALFLSPENGTPTKYGNSVNAEGKIYSSDSDETKKFELQEKSKKVEVLKWLSQQDFDVDVPRKRLREKFSNYSEEKKRKCSRRSLNFGDEEVAKPQNNVTSLNAQCNPTQKRAAVSMSNLSQNHKNKLLWAVSVVLKENNISRNDENFKICASTLFHTCRKNLCEILSVEIGNGTSDKILNFARKQIPAIFEEHGIKCPERKEGASKTCGDFGKTEITDDSKENINQDNVKNAGGCLSNEEFIFKTPRKVCRKRVVKSCHKDDGRRMQNVRRWHSLESLIVSDGDLANVKVVESNVPSSAPKENVSSCVNVDNEKASDLPVSVCLGSDASCAMTRLREVDTSVVFTPIPSSVSEDCDTENVAYPVLSKNYAKDKESPTEVDCDIDGYSTDNDNKEIVNQDIIVGDINILALGDGFCEVRRKDDAEESAANASGELANPRSPAVAYNETLHSPTAQDCDMNETDSVKEEDSNAIEDEDDESEDDAQDSVGQAKYKPRKLIVKKSRPNWKVVRKSTDETELRLKMRLSHEWEIVCRNSSCSDIGNTSECEATSLNCSQVSSTNDEKDESSEIEGDENGGRVQPASEERQLTDPEWTHHGLSASEQETRVADSESCLQNNTSADQALEEHAPDDREPISTSTVVTENDAEISETGCEPVCAVEGEHTISQPQEQPFPIQSTSKKTVRSISSSDIPTTSEDEVAEKYLCDSESGHSISPSNRHTKKRLLSLENYKARKLKEASNEATSPRTSPEHKHETGEVKKIYNIRLKHPIGSKSHKYKGHRERRKHRSKTKPCEASSNEGDPSERVEKPCQDPSNVNVQTIVDALSTLSSLVQQQIKLENEMKVNTDKDGKNKWVDVVSSWCWKSLSNVKNQSSDQEDAPQLREDNEVVAPVSNPSLTHPDPQELSQNVCLQVSDQVQPVYAYVPATVAFTPHQQTYVSEQFAVGYQTHAQPKPPSYAEYQMNGAPQKHVNATYPADCSLSLPYSYPVQHFDDATSAFQQGTMYQYSNWQLSSTVNSWNYQQFSDGYQMSSYYPCQVSNLSYYHNNF